jgi:hypothetical protein
MFKKSRSGSGRNIPDHISKILKILEFFYADPGSVIFLTLDPGSWMKNSDPESGINIPDQQHWFLFALKVLSSEMDQAESRLIR